MSQIREAAVTLDELDRTLSNGFHDAEVSSIELNYIANTATFRLSLWVGFMGDPQRHRETYQDAILKVTGLCFCTIGPPDPNYRFLPGGRPIVVDGDPAKADHLPELPALSEKLPKSAWCYRFFVTDWNAFIQIAAQDAEIEYVGAPRIAAP
jgi:hypothetical protein